MTYVRSTRRTLLFAAAGLALALPVWAEEATVPLQLQANLSAKVIEYAKRPTVRSSDVVRIGIVVKGVSPESVRAGAELKIAFDRLPNIAGRPHEQSILQWSDASNLAAEARRQKLTVVYFTPGLDAEVPAIAQALHGMCLITIAALDSYVHSGAILGFELISGHPKMLFNLAQAKKQDVFFGSAVMNLMRIVQ